MSSASLRKKQFFSASVIFALLITVSAVQPHDVVWKFLPSEALQSAAHVVVYSILTYLICLWLLFARSFLSIKMTEARVLSCAFALSMLWGIFNEFLQKFCPTRYSDIHDVGFNAIGAVIGMLVFLGRLHLARKRSK